MHLDVKAEDGGTRLTYSEHGVFLDGLDDPAGREGGANGCWASWTAI